MDLIVDKILDRTERIREFRLVATNGTLPPWTPGAHLDFELGKVGTRSYSLIDWSGETDDPGHYTIAVQREDDGEGGSKAMHALAAGDVITSAEPKNDFELIDVKAPIYLLAGGIGVTPLISMAATLSADRRPFQMHYACRSSAVAAYARELSDKLGDTFTLQPDDANPINLQAIAVQAASTQAHLYICGPRGMIDTARTAAEAARIPADHIHVELFSTPSASTADQPFEVEIQDTGQVFIIPPGQTIISVLNAAGIDLIYDCQRGDCGICQVDVIDGIPDHRDVVLTDAEKAKNDVMQICVSRSKSPRLVLDI